MISSVWKGTYDEFTRGCLWLCCEESNHRGMEVIYAAPSYIFHKSSSNVPSVQLAVHQEFLLFCFILQDEDFFGSIGHPDLLFFNELFVRSILNTCLNYQFKYISWKLSSVGKITNHIKRTQSLLVFTYVFYLCMCIERLVPRVQCLRDLRKILAIISLTPIVHLSEYTSNLLWRICDQHFKCN